jgi:hypothetical protein
MGSILTFVYWTIGFIVWFGLAVLVGKCIKFGMGDSDDQG